MFSLPVQSLTLSSLVQGGSWEVGAGDSELELLGQTEDPGALFLGQVGDSVSLSLGKTFRAIVSPVKGVGLNQDWKLLLH